MSQTGQLKVQLENPRKVLYEVRNLGVTFKRRQGFFRRRESIVQAIRNISFDVYESEILSIVGESGSGKTTIARCMIGLAAPTTGSIKFLDMSLKDLSGKKLRNYWSNAQMVFQDPFESLNPRLDVRTTLSVPLRRLAREKDEKKIDLEVHRLLSEVGLDPASVIYKFPHQLSGGERQRVNIAKALAPNPRVLIADEPITMLDASQRLNVLSLLVKLKDSRNLTIILITHDLASAKLMSDRIIVMYAGSIMEIGPTLAILTKPRHPYTELILAATPRLVARKYRKISPEIAQSGTEDAVKINQGCLFMPRCKYSTAICAEEEPLLSEKSSMHLAACHNPLQVNSAKSNISEKDK